MIAPHQPAHDVLYGINPVFETILAGRRTVHRLYLASNTASSKRGKSLESIAKERNIPVEHTEKGRLNTIANTREHQGAVLETDSFPYTPFADLLQKQRLVLLDNIEDPNNTGAIIRSAEVLGFDGVLLPRRGSPLIRPSVVKASAGASEHMTVACNCSSNQYIKIALEEGWTVCALDGKGTVTVDETDWSEIERILLVVGGENKGVGQFILNSASNVIRIPQAGKVNSLNASVAAGIAMYAIMNS